LIQGCNSVLAPSGACYCIVVQLERKPPPSLSSLSFNLKNWTLFKAEGWTKSFSSKPCKTLGA